MLCVSGYIETSNKNAIMEVIDVLQHNKQTVIIFDAVH